ncbi:2-methoxy-6-polyprenyl-1,4-benzoquinol methylase, mitochondrial [Orchesella cincta]|uniref:2-methoxy-6-polyprenyl-1,4-benzoquinol methylase, mitochondrial n=1 Tax=Orchesella cincta TaxID=48709 RepID=A0A1D2NJM9_ORCCI|nr:2-methoxy-6-polyprenyl-1,4-benzoquinol methylase, mitochondrial [Orchesella cincta]
MIETGRKVFSRTRNWKRFPLVRSLGVHTTTVRTKGTTANESRQEDVRYSSDKETHFGFETVSEAEKADKVKSVFENVAARYDLMNDCMSVGVHRVWKDIFVHRINPGANTRMIDVAGGTGKYFRNCDIAFRFLKFQLASTKSDTFRVGSPISILDPRVELPPDQPRAENEAEAQYQAVGSQSSLPKNEELTSRSVLVSDINPRMLEVGQKRSLTALTADEQKRIDWLEADAENLETIPDESFDVYTIAFGIRNCVHIENVIHEAYRVLKPGGRFMCLEFSQVPNSLLRWVYDQYSFQVIPAMGQVIAGDWDSYKYLVESIRKFPNQEEFKSLIQQAGFRFVSYENLTFGVTAIHSGYKI